MIYTKETLIKTKAEASEFVVTRNISHFCRIRKDAFSPGSKSDESDNGFEHSRHNNNDNHNHNNRCYFLCNRESPCIYSTVLEHYIFWLNN